MKKSFPQGSGNETLAQLLRTFNALRIKKECYDMRKILFRGKRTDNGEWVEGDLIHYDGEPSIHTKASYGLYKHERVDPSTVGQFTGLRDAAGTCIFEGDIVRVDPTRISGMEYEGFDAVVGFTDGGFGLERVSVYRRCNEHGLKHGFCEPFWLHGLGTCAVIGNVYDSPELLDEEETP